MNECIAKLANQSGFDVDITGKFGNYSEMHRLEKFAELIVAECMELVEGYTKQRTHTTFYKAEEQIKQHFGVEE